MYGTTMWSFYKVCLSHILYFPPCFYYHQNWSSVSWHKICVIHLRRISAIMHEDKFTESLLICSLLGFVVFIANLFFVRGGGGAKIQLVNLYFTGSQFILWGNCWRVPLFPPYKYFFLFYAYVIFLAVIFLHYIFIFF